MRFVDRTEVEQAIAGKRIAIVGSGPGALENAPGFVDSHDLVVRVNNYKTGAAAGFRCDVHYSFYGSSIRKTAEELKADGARLCLCKCPDAKFMESEWHRLNHKPHGVDFRYIYRDRKSWWFCDTYVPTVEEFVASFDLLQRHIPSTGFSALLLALSCSPASIYLTGFDFFSSMRHNVDEPWRPGNPSDPIGHAPELERRWLARHLDLVSLDPALTAIMQKEVSSAVLVK
jgi:hypothetical protein